MPTGCVKCSLSNSLLSRNTVIMGFKGEAPRKGPRCCTGHNQEYKLPELCPCFVSIHVTNRDIQPNMETVIIHGRRTPDFCPVSV